MSHYLKKKLFFWLLFKALPSKVLAQKGKKCKGAKKSKQRMIVAFFARADGGKVDKPIVIWKSKKPRCFKRTNAASNLKQVSYFADAKLWMQIDFQVFVSFSFMSYNPDTGIKDPHLSLKL